MARAVDSVQFSAFREYAGSAIPVVPDAQNSDYESGSVDIDGEAWHIRTARNTPTKPGAFVAFWQRDDAGKTAPFPADDPMAGLLVFVEQDGQRGVFRFTTRHLEQLGITAGSSPGKRGFRVYPMWCTNLNPQATSAQRSQAPAFRVYY